MQGSTRISRFLIVSLVAVLATAGLAGCSGRVASNDIPMPEGVSEDTTQTSVFYSTGRSLLQEHRVVAQSTIYESTLKELLLASPEENPGVAVVQPVAKVNSVTFAKGLVTVDWAASVLTFEAEPAEKRLALASILATFGQFPEVKQVKFTVEGKTDGEIDGKDVKAFWGAVSLINQPWDVLHIKSSSPDSTEASGSAEATAAQ